LSSGAGTAKKKKKAWTELNSTIDDFITNPELTIILQR